MFSPKPLAGRKGLFYYGFDRMEQRPSRPAMAASLALHAAAAAVLWAHATDFQISKPRAGPVIEISLGSPAGPLSGIPEAAQSTPSPQLPPDEMMGAVASGQSLPAATAASAQGDPLVLPPKEAPYLPAGEVDVRAQPTSAVIVPYPDAPLGKTKGSAVLVLYVNEDGKVERIEVDQSDLPPAFERTAVEAFMQASMHPAIKSGQRVRTRMKILVEFEARTTTSLKGARY